MYCIWIKIDETLPWIELKEAYQTRSEARRAARQALKMMNLRIVRTPEQSKPMKPLAVAKTRR